MAAADVLAAPQLLPLRLADVPRAGHGERLAGAGLSFNYPGSFPYLSDPWDGYDNPSVQNMAVRGNP